MNDVGGPPSWLLATLRASKLVLLVSDEEYHVWPSKTNLESIESLTYLEWKPKNGAEDKEYRRKLQRYLPLQSKDMVICWILIYKLISIQCRHFVCNVCYIAILQNHRIYIAWIYNVSYSHSLRLKWQATKFSVNCDF